MGWSHGGYYSKRRSRSFYDHVGDVKTADDEEEEES